MKLKLELNGFFEQIYDMSYGGRLISKDAFRCASIDDNNYSVEDMNNADTFPKFVEHVEMNIRPVIEKGLEKTDYTVHCVDWQQGEIRPHLVLCRKGKDFPILNEDDCLAIQKNLKAVIENYNASYQENLKAKHPSRLFANKDHVNSQVLESSQHHQYHLRHK